MQPEAGTPAPRRPVRLTTVGAAFAANKGAASMLQAVIDKASGHLGPCEIDVLSAYPREDRAWASRAGVRMVPWPPVSMVLGYPLALLAFLARRAGLPARPFCRMRALRALHDADVVVDVSGISFADGRGFVTLVYNLLITSTSLLLGRPTVKASQALGSFRTRLNRLAARAVLPHLAAVCARGGGTERNLADLGLDNVTPAADLAFLLDLPESARQRAAAVAGAAIGDDDLTVAVMPSQVVASYCARLGVDYPDLMAKTVDALVERRQARVLLFPHAWRPSTQPSRMNDRPLCAAVYERVTARDRVTLIDADLSPHDLRALISLADLAVTSRFHGMVSALCTGTPPVVVGWSHKYREVLEPFGMDEQALSYEALSVDSLVAAIERTLAETDKMRARIAEALPAAQASSERSLERIAAALPPVPAGS
ncbi:MAG: hypothetical protein GEU81_12845 [Nitriliruptorales bacterium]|nr:hypothetical protein [Nitriliruptorales bacterium]